MTRSTTIAFVVVAAAGIAVAAGPRFITSTCCPNYVSAIATLRNIASAENEFRTAARIDVDRDGIGEFGFLAELSGAAALPGGSGVLVPPGLSGVFRNVESSGVVRRAGYFFRVWLPDARGEGVTEIGRPPAPPPGPPPAGMGACCWSGPALPTIPARAAPTDRVDPKLASRRWCAYAWPVEFGRTGSATFFIHEGGVLFRTETPRYSGEHGPDAGAAFVSGGRFAVTGETQSGARSQDGEVWTALR